MDLLEDVKPHQIYAAGDLSDPHGTHRVCLTAIFEAISRLNDRAWLKQCEVWLYRGAWQEWGIDEIEMAVPLSPDEVHAQAHRDLQARIARRTKRCSPAPTSANSGSAPKTATARPPSRTTSSDWRNTRRSRRSCAGSRKLSEPTRIIRVGVIGLGFMGATHLRAYASAASAGFACEVVAVADADESRRRGMLGDVGGNLDTRAQPSAFDVKRVRGYASGDEMIADPRIDLVSICTPTDSHAALAQAALRAGKHVLVEKPVALHAEQIAQLDDVAKSSGRICMPAMCMRFWPGWDWLKARIDDRAYGACTSATFTRLGSSPIWSSDFYRDGRRSGGAIADLHVHDADFVRHCFGPPDAVSRRRAGWRQRRGRSRDDDVSLHARQRSGPRRR